MSELDLAAFGSRDGSLWAVLCVGGGGGPELVLGDGDQAVAIADGLEVGPGLATVSGDGIALELADADPVAGDGPGVTGDGAEGQVLCHVTGTVTVGGESRPVDCPGIRARAAVADDSDTVRLVGAWFGDAEALCLVADRGAQAPHGDDALAASLFEPTGWIAVTDPRLSTTYDGDGLVTAMSLELWVGDGDDEFPRRAAGEAVASSAAVADVGTGLRVAPLRCHSRGEEGAGVYAVATPARMAGR